MSERPTEYFEQFKGFKFPVSKYRIKGKKLSAFAAAIGVKNPKYYVPDPENPEEKVDYSGIEAHPAYAACYTIPKLLEALPDIKGSDGEPMLKNIGKLVGNYTHGNVIYCIKQITYLLDTFDIEYYDKIIEVSKIIKANINKYEREKKKVRRIPESIQEKYLGG